MHIADGILSWPVLVAGGGGTLVIAGATMLKMDLEEIPKVSVMAAVFFVVNLIHIPIGPTSIHFIMNGLVGVILGKRAFPAIMLGVILQAFLFGFGGVTVVGVNCVMLGGGALVAYFVWQLRHWFSWGDRLEMVFGALAGSTGIFVSGVILAAAVFTSGEEFLATAGYALAAHVPALIIEAFVVAVCASFLKKTKPDMLAGFKKTMPDMFADQGQMVLASAGQRYWTMWLDFFFYFVFSVVLGMVSVLIGLGDILEKKHNYYLLSSIIYLIYYISQEAFFGRTLGKLIMGTKVVNEDGTKLTFGRAVGRTLCRFIPFEAFTFLGGKGRPIGCHDYVPKTKVISVRRIS